MYKMIKGSHAMHTYMRTYIHAYIHPKWGYAGAIVPRYIIYAHGMCVCVCVYIYIYIYIHTHMHTPTYTHAHTVIGVRLAP
jgi:hypothetical protein